MSCTGCGFELLASFAFCPRCGRAQPTACPACGALSAAEFSFCPYCGTARGAATPAAAGAAPQAIAKPIEPGEAAASAAANPDADRRQVTVLFADVSGFT